MQKIIKMTIKRLPLALGHKQHMSGVGVHGDKRLKRQQTRQGQKLQTKKEWGI